MGVCLTVWQSCRKVCGLFWSGPIILPSDKGSHYFGIISQQEVKTTLVFMTEGKTWGKVVTTDDYHPVWSTNKTNHAFSTNLFENLKVLWSWQWILFSCICCITSQIKFIKPVLYSTPPCNHPQDLFFLNICLAVQVRMFDPEFLR